MADLRSMPAPEDDDAPEPPRLRALRRLVTLLTMSAIIGVLVVAATLVIRLSQPLTPAADLRSATAASITLPAGEEAVSAALTAGALTVLTRDGAGVERLRLFDPADGAPGPVVEIARQP